MRIVTVQVAETQVTSEASAPLPDSRTAAALLAALLGAVPPPPQPGPDVSLTRATALLLALALEIGVTMEATDPPQAVEKAGREEYASEADPLLAAIETEFRPQYLRRKG